MALLSTLSAASLSWTTPQRWRCPTAPTARSSLVGAGPPPQRSHLGSRRWPAPDVTVNAGRHSCITNSDSPLRPGDATVAMRRPLLPAVLSCRCCLDALQAPWTAPLSLRTATTARLRWPAPCSRPTTAPTASLVSGVGAGRWILSAPAAAACHACLPCLPVRLPACRLSSTPLFASKHRF